MTTTETAGWVHTEEAYILQRGEGRQAEYEVRVGTRVEPAGTGDEAFLAACRIRDELVRELQLDGEVLKAIPEEEAPPSPGDPTMAPVQFLELRDEGKALIRLGEHETEVDLDLLRRA